MTRRKRFCAIFVAGALAAAMLAGCASQGAEAGAGADAAGEASEQAEAVLPAAGTEAAEDTENYDTGDASLDDPRNQDGIGEKELLVVSFGTSFNNSRRLTIGAIEDAMEEAFPDYSVRRGFTSQIIIDHVKERDGIAIDNVTEALDRAADNGVRELVIQPTHLMDGLEYNDLVDEVARYSDAFENIAVGKPLLTSDEDFQAVISAITSATEEYDDGETAICFMGHGTEAESNAVYGKMQEMLTEAGYENYYIGTVEADPSLEDVVAAVKEGSYRRVVLEPLMIVAGDHANNDMAGDEEGTWKNAFEEEGYEVECLLVGLGELPGIQEILVEHAREAAGQDGGDSQVASSEEMAEPVELDLDGLVPLPGSSMKDGIYPITVDSSSSMFRIVDCQLTVEGGEMTALMTMSGTGYAWLFPGKGEDAVNAAESQWIPYQENESGAYCFEFPVEALDQATDCSAYSSRKEKWYDRTLVFRADSLPADALAEGAAATASSLGLADGDYQVAVTLAGGSGKASVDSPAKLRVEGGQAYAEIVWSSPNYDYMRLGVDRYDPLDSEGNSNFEIPVSAFDRGIAVVADTVAMSEPHEIEYTLTFDSSTIEKTGE